jgi:Mrp family chromosome partitioning ATPase
MSRIDEALKRATDRHRVDETVESFTLQEYAGESASEPDGAGRSGLAPQPSGQQGKPSVNGTFTPPPPKPQTGAPAAPQRLRLVLSPRASASASLAAPSSLTLNAGSPLVQQCRRLAGVLHDRQVDHGLKRVAIASAVDTEGKAQIAVHLALTLARTYASRVLLIDADTRPPFVHELIGGHNDVGLSDALRGDRREIPLIQLSPVLQVLTVGRPASNATPDVMSPRMPALVDDCAALYDWVLLNAPATSLLPEDQVLTRLTQAVVFVIGASTSFPIVESAIAELGRESIIGTVLVGTEEKFPPFRRAEGI